MAKSNENCNYAPQANLVMNKNDKKTQLINNQTASNEVTTGKNKKQEKKQSSIKHTNSKKDNVINKRVIILGDSMIRNVRGWEIAKKLDNTKVYVNSFKSATVRSMKDYIKPSIREDPDHFILHLGTNELDLERPADLIAKSIADIGSKLKNDKHDVSISNIIARNDSLKDKVKEVNDCLESICIERNFHLIDHSKTLNHRHLNGSRLHLNDRGDSILEKDFVNAIANFFN